MKLGVKRSNVVPSLDKAQHQAVSSVESTESVIIKNISTIRAAKSLLLDLPAKEGQLSAWKLISNALDNIESQLTALASSENIIKNKTIFFKSDGKLVKVVLADIAYFENIGDYVKVVTSDTTHVIFSTMKNLQEKLPNSYFRCHRSFIINPIFIKDILDNSIVMDSGKIIPISRNQKSAFFDSINVI